MSHSLGIELPLSSGTIQTLQRQRLDILSSRNDNGNGNNNVHEFGGDNMNDSDKEDEERSFLSPNDDDMIGSGIEEEDRAIMPFRPSDDEDDDDNASANSDNDKNDDDDDSIVSLSPPPTMPILRLDLEKLCGYQPSTDEERMRLTNEIRAVLLGPNHDKIKSQVPVVDENQNKNENGDTTDAAKTSENNDSDRKEEQEQDQKKEDVNVEDEYVALDFIVRSRELFEAGIARHDTTKDKNFRQDDNDDNGQCNVQRQQNDMVSVPYPEFLPIYQHETQSSMLQSTQQLWKKILRPHDIDVVQQILNLLTSCSRDLIWKYQMDVEIRNISRLEQRRYEDQEAQRQIRIWRRETRPKELAKLYDVRETFELRLHTSRSKYDMYVKERDIRVQRELRRRRENGSGTGGIAGLDWDGKITFAFDEDNVDDVVQSMIQEQRRRELGDFLESEEDDGYHHNLDNDNDDESDSMDSLSDGDSLEESSHSHSDNKPSQSSSLLPLEKTVSSLDEQQSQLPTPPVLPITSKSDRKKRRAAAAAKRQRKKLLSQKEIAMAADLRAKVEAAHAEEKYVRNMLISTDEKFAHATVLNLEQQLEKVDELIETLQEEEWKDEEEGLMDDDNYDDSNDDKSIQEKGQDEPSILNPILAMILSAIPLEHGCDSNEHFSSLKRKHESILTEWRNKFGRLPPMNMDAAMEDEERKEPITSIDDKEQVAWDSEEDDVGADGEDSRISSQFNKLSFGGSKTEMALPSSSMPLPSQPSTTAFSVPDDWEDTVADDDWDVFFQPQDTLTHAAGIDNDMPSSRSPKQLSSKVPQESSKPSLRPGGRRR